VKRQGSTFRSFLLPDKKQLVDDDCLEIQHIQDILDQIKDNVCNSLTVVKGFVDLIKRKTGSDLCREYFEIIDSEIDKLIFAVDNSKKRFRQC